MQPGGFLSTPADRVRCRLIFGFGLLRSNDSWRSSANTSGRHEIDLPPSNESGFDVTIESGF